MWSGKRGDETPKLRDVGWVVFVYVYESPQSPSGSRS